MTEEMVHSLIICFLTGIGLVIVRKAAAGLMRLLGALPPTHEIIADAAFKFVFLGLIVATLVTSPSPVVSVCLFLLWLACIGVGCEIADFMLKSRSGNLLPTPVKWGAIGLLIVVLALVVGSGYPLNPIATIDLVNLMKDGPLTAFLLCVIAAAAGFVLSSTQGETIDKSTMDNSR